MCEHGLVFGALIGQQHELVGAVFDDAAAGEQSERADANRGDEIRDLTRGQMLRRIAYTLLTFFLNVTLRSDDSRMQPWKTLMRNLDIALLTARAEDLAGLREHPAPT